MYRIMVVLEEYPEKNDTGCLTYAEQPSFHFEFSTEEKAKTFERRLSMAAEFLAMEVEAEDMARGIYE